jgi:hypothetical protein
MKIVLIDSNDARRQQTERLLILDVRDQCLVLRSLAELVELGAGDQEYSPPELLITHQSDMRLSPCDVLRNLRWRPRVYIDHSYGEEQPTRLEVFDGAEVVSIRSQQMLQTTSTFVERWRSDSRPRVDILIQPPRVGAAFALAWLCRIYLDASNTAGVGESQPSVHNAAAPAPDLDGKLLCGIRSLLTGFAWNEAEYRETIDLLGPDEDQSRALEELKSMCLGSSDPWDRNVVQNALEALWLVLGMGQAGSGP